MKLESNFTFPNHPIFPSKSLFIEVSKINTTRSIYSDQFWRMVNLKSLKLRKIKLSIPENIINQIL